MKLKDLLCDEDCYSTKFIKPFVIAEAGVNHEGKMQIAKRLIDEAADAGADAIKFQSYKADKLASKNSPAYWDLSKEKTTSQYELFKKYDSFWKNEFEQLATYCSEKQIEFLSTPFDTESANFLNDLMDVFKISSSDLNNKPFVEYVCNFGKPIILSTGASWLWEIEQTLSWIDKSKNKVALLHCVLNYPTYDENANLYAIRTLKRKFPDRLIGYSDHTLPKSMKTLEIAAALGARIIEKHFTHDKTLTGNDHYHAMDKNDLALFNRRMDSLESLMGSGLLEPKENEFASRNNARRSLVAKRLIPAGKIIDKDDIIWKRPGTGIDPRDIDLVIGSKALVNISEDDILDWSSLSKC